jgi:DNA-binding NarL/FixJ family response regulator
MNSSTPEIALPTALLHRDRPLVVREIAGAIQHPSRTLNVDVIIADDCEITRIGLRQVLESKPGYAVTGDIGDSSKAFPLILQFRPGLLLIDSQILGVPSNQIVERIGSAGLETKVIAFTSRTDRVSIIRMLKAGARGYVLKTSSPTELLRAIDVVLRGGTYLSPSVAEIVSGLATREDRGSDLRRPGELLSARETEVLQAIVAGKQNKEIATELHVTVRTIESHRSQLMKKLDLRSVASLTKYAIREGLTPMDQ